MGELADELIDRAIMDGSFAFRPKYPRPACMYCGAQRLHWGSEGSRWVLLDTKTMLRHHCVNRDPDADFGALT